MDEAEDVLRSRFNALTLFYFGPRYFKRWRDCLMFDVRLSLM